MVKMHAIIRPAFVILLGLFLCSCTSLAFSGGSLALYNLFKDPEVNLVHKSNAAADILNYRGSAYLTKSATRIVAQPLDNSAQPGFQSEFASIIPRYVGERLRYLGYSVDLSDVSESKANATKIANPHMVLSGTYAHRLKDLEVDVSLYLMETATGRPVAQFEYTLPVNQELRRALEVKPQIYRVNRQEPQM